MEEVERKKNVREEEGDFPGTLYVSDSKALSKQTTYPLWAWSDHGGKATIWALPMPVSALVVRNNPMPRKQGGTNLSGETKEVLSVQLF